MHWKEAARDVLFKYDIYKGPNVWGDSRKMLGKMRGQKGEWANWFLSLT